MQYKGYSARIEYVQEAATFHGEVVDLRDVVTFQGKSVAELQQAFEESIDDYLEFCRSRGEKPEKPFSGKFVLRIPPELHHKIYIKASQSGTSLNNWVKTVLEEAVNEENSRQG